jgi:hypothetical protein
MRELRRVATLGRATSCLSAETLVGDDRGYQCASRGDRWRRTAPNTKVRMQSRSRRWPAFVRPAGWSYLPRHSVALGARTVALAVLLARPTLHGRPTPRARTTACSAGALVRRRAPGSRARDRSRDVRAHERDLARRARDRPASALPSVRSTEREYVTMVASRKPVHFGRPHV